MTDSQSHAETSSKAAGEVSDSDYLRQLGVEPRLKRALGFVTGSLFAVAFQGPTTGALLLTGATVALGGPAFIWAIPIIFAFQLLLAFTWAELNSHFPLSGGIYQWARRLGGNEAGWFTGLFYLVAIVLVMPAVGSVVNIVLNGLFSSIDISETNTVIIAIITTVVAGLLMATSVRFVGLINSIGVTLELALLLIGAIVLLFHHHQNLSVLTNTGGSEGKGSYIVPFLIIIALVTTQFVGFETAGAFAEETENSRIKPSQAIIAGLGGAALFVFIFDLCLLLAIPDVGKAMTNPSLIPSILKNEVGEGFEKLFLVGALIAVASTAIATLATIVRTIYGMARNDQLPAKAFLTKLAPGSEEPLGSIVVGVLLSLIPLIFIKKIEVIVAAITAMILIPYIIVLTSLLYRRLTGWPRQESKFNLRGWGLPVTIVGLVWTLFVFIDSIWPRDVTNPKFGIGPMRVIDDIAVGTLVVGAIWWYAYLRPRAEPVPPLD
jgi:amino acid transporter